MVYNEAFYLRIIKHGRKKLMPLTPLSLHQFPSHLQRQKRTHNYWTAISTTEDPYAKLAPNKLGFQVEL
jgi:hypothetical protein